MKETFWEYLHFTPTEKRGIAVFFILLIAIIFLPSIYSSLKTENVFDASEFEEDITHWEAGLIEQDSSGNKKYFERNWDYKPSSKKKSPYKKKAKKETAPVEIKPFPFDPNQASKSKLMALGLPKRIAETIINFREKGGAFREAEDLKKIYGFKSEWFNILESSIRIEQKEFNKQSNNYPTKKDKEKDLASLDNIPESYDSQKIKKEKIWPKKEYEPVIVDINTSSEQELQKVYGIGPTLSKRIVKYRKSLGGFVKVKQISEIYGLPDSSYQKIKGSLIIGQDNPNIKQININTSTVDELKAHPYLSWKLANAILKFKKTHGEFKSLDDLDKIYALSPEVLTKLKPYLTVE